MKALITFIVLLILPMIGFAQIPGKPCSTCPQNVNVAVNVDTSTIEGQLDYGNGQNYQLIQQSAENNRQNDAMLAALLEGNRLQKKGNTIATIGLVLDGVNTAANVGTYFETRGIRKQGRIQQTNVYRSYKTTNNTTTNTTTTNNNGGNGDTGGTITLPGHNDNQVPLPTGNRGNQNRGKVQSWF